MDSPASFHRSKDSLLKRLEPYWKMEAANIAAIPIMALYMTSGRIGWVTLVPLAATMVLLGIGAAYWRLKVRQLRGDAVNGDAVLRWLAWLQWPSLTLSAAGCAAAALGWITPAFSVGLPDRIAATVCAALAGLEYVNYYHRQLQHFDNKADFRRLLAGKGFRPSWMARDLAAWRARA
ncbi:MAG: hypothetical protein WBL74_14520 [Novosphingobium sp.]|uniref:hypothetical protein n=1 Tax=Novosphingobium sp. TaxID=1874826 RepID=UPI003C7B2901